jgi:hypothetical protein
VHLDTHAVQLVFEGRTAELAQRLLGCLRGLRQHGLQRAKELDAVASERALSAREGRARDLRQRARQHQRAPHGTRADLGCSRHGLCHQALERTLPQLPDHQTSQELLFWLGSALEQGSPEPQARGRAARAAHGLNRVQRTLDVCHLELARAARGWQGLPIDRRWTEPDAPAQQLPRQEGNARFQAAPALPIPEQAVDAGRQRLHLAQAAARLLHRQRSLNQALESHPETYSTECPTLGGPPRSVRGPGGSGENSSKLGARWQPNAATGW